MKQKFGDANDATTFVALILYSLIDTIQLVIFSVIEQIMETEF